MRGNPVGPRSGRDYSIFQFSAILYVICHTIYVDEKTINFILKGLLFMKNKSKKMCFYLDEERDIMLMRIAYETGMNASSIVRLAITKLHDSIVHDKDVYSDDDEDLSF